MTTLPNSSGSFSGWSPKAKEMAAEAKVLSGNKLEQLVIRIQRYTGRPKETCWRFVIQYGIKNKPEYRRWTDPEFELVRGRVGQRDSRAGRKEAQSNPQGGTQHATEEPTKPTRHPMR